MEDPNPQREREMNELNNKPHFLQHHPKPPSPTPNPLKKLASVASIAAGVQFGWALQLSLLTPYVQLLGIPHTWAAYIWLCGPISGMLVQPIVGYHSDRCHSRFGRRKPFIAAGAAAVVLAVLLIGFAVDLGRLLGDPLGFSHKKPRAITIFVLGFWFLDVANNTLQGPCRALLADLADKDQRRTRSANAFYSFFMGVGNVLGFAAGSFSNLYKLLPFTETQACNIYCANLKTCFLIAILLLTSLTVFALSSVKEKLEEDGDREEAVTVAARGEMIKTLRELLRPIRVLLVVTFLNWLAWFPFLLFDTDWMGREVYGGGEGRERAYAQGVRAGALGLMFNSVVQGCTALAIEFFAGKIRGVKKLWGFVNFLLSLCLGSTVLITKAAEYYRRRSEVGVEPPIGVKVSAMALFAVLGIPLAVTYSIPFALASIFSNSSGAGQGLAMGVLNLAVVIPQMIISISSGPWDANFGGGNLPAFVVGAVAAMASGVVALTMLPSLPPDSQPLEF